MHDLVIPEGCANLAFSVGKREVRLTNLQKAFWPELGITKGELLQYYANVAPSLLPHHVYVPIVRGPLQKEVWSFAKAFAISVARKHPKLITSEYRVAKRPKGHVLVDYNQNAWGRTLASVYSVRPQPAASVSTPVTWEEVSQGVRTEDFTLRNVPSRLKKVGDLWRPLLKSSGRFDLRPLFNQFKAA